MLFPVSCLGGRMGCCSRLVVGRVGCCSRLVALVVEWGVVPG